MSTLVINLFISLRTYFIYLHSFIITVITCYHCYYYYNYYIYISVWQIIALAGTPAVPFWALNNYLGVLLLPQLTGHQIQIWPMQSRSLELYRCSIYPWCKLANQRLRPAAATCFQASPEGSCHRHSYLVHGSQQPGTWTPSMLNDERLANMHEIHDHLPQRACGACFIHA